MTGYSHRSYNADDADHEVFTRLAHDVAQCLKGLQFLSSQNERLSKQYWANYFQICSQVGVAFRALLGQNSLDFDARAAFYARFDRLQATSLEHHTVHPKEKTFTVDSIHTEILVYLSTVSSVKAEVLNLYEVFSRELNRKVVAITVHIKHIQSRLKLREKLFSKYKKLEKKASKLEKKTRETDIKTIDKATAEYDEYATKLASASAKYQALNTKLKNTLPELLLLVEEFISQLSKWAVCQNHQISMRINNAFHQMCQDFGFLKTPENIEVPDWDSIDTQWEIDATPPRLRVESLLSAIYEKHPNLIDEETVPFSKSKKWQKLTKKVEQEHHEVKPKDRASGIFHDHQMADPLSSYLKYQDQAINVSETYHPSKLLDKSEALSEPIPAVESLVPPPLPPRDESKLINVSPLGSFLGLNSPQMSLKSAFSSLPKTPTLDSEHTFFPPPYSPVSNSIFGQKSVDKSPKSESQLSLETDVNETISSSLELASDSDLFSDMAQKKLVWLYNRQKNEIVNVPITTTKTYDMTSRRQPSDDLSDPKNSLTLKLLVLKRFYDKLLDADNDKHIVTAKHKFSGISAGDLSVEIGDDVEVIFDLQKNILTFARNGQNWVVGATKASEIAPRRIGFIPNTCV